MRGHISRGRKEGKEPERALFAISQGEGVRVKASAIVGAKVRIKATTRCDA